MRHPALTALLERCRNPARDAQILDLAFLQEQPNEEIARHLGISKSIVTHVVSAARRYLLDYATAQQGATSAESAPPMYTTTNVIASSGSAPATRRLPEATMEQVTAGEHVDSQLLGLFLGYTPPVKAIYKHLAEHLVRCSECQSTLGSLLEALTTGTAASTNNHPHVEGQVLLVRLQNVIQRTEARGRRLETPSELVNDDTQNTIE